MEEEIMLTGIGGQGVQLAAQVLARAATLEGRDVMCLGTYGGTMRGGSTDSVIVVADGPISAPPIVSRVGSALAMHHAHFRPIEQKLRSDAVVVVNSSVFEGEVNADRVNRFDVPATELATQLGNPLAASMILIAAYAQLTGILSLESLIGAMRESIPPYRRQNIEANEQALRMGHGRVPARIVPRPKAAAGSVWQTSAGDAAQPAQDQPS